MIDFHGLKVWHKAHALTLDVYRETSHALRRDRSLAAQARRAAGSVSANIVEGCGGSSEAELGRFLHFALKSAVELEYHLLLAHDLGYLPQHRYEKLRSATLEVKRMLTGLLKRIEKQE
ncbi:MAG TPA: four helix bundle protein [Gemmatimonadaceae bacterium]|nr:four helix bundle protein [Gemmatimonadaceae bacterium]